MEQVVKGKAALLLQRLLVGFVFTYASLDKLRHPRLFVDVIASYEILHTRLVTITAVWLPWLELVVGICLLMGVLSRASALILGVLSAVFIAAVGSIAARGMELDCGCFALMETVPISIHLVLNCILLALCTNLLRHGSGHWSFDEKLFPVAGPAKSRGWVLGGMMVLLGILWSPSAVAFVASADGEISTQWAQSLIHLTRLLLVALGIALLTKLKLQTRFRAPLLLALTIMIVGGAYSNIGTIGRPVARGQKIPRSTTIREIQTALDALAKSVASSDSNGSTKNLLTSRVMLTDIAPKRPEWISAGVSIKTTTWPLAEMKIVDRENFKFLSSFIEGCTSVDWLELKLRSVEVSGEKCTALLDLRALGLEREQRLLASGRVLTDWMRGEENNWMLMSWEFVEPVKLASLTSPIFKEVQESVIEEPEIVTKSLYEEKIYKRLNGEEPTSDISMYLGVKRRPTISVVDIDSDGWDDLFVTRRSGNCVLLHNEGGHFVEVAQEFNLNRPGPTFASLFVDMDNDGDKDLILGEQEQVVYLENRDGQFVLRNIMPDLREAGSLAAADIDGDGLLDLAIPLLGRQRQPRPFQLVLLRNTGEGFEEIAIKSKPVGESARPMPGRKEPMTRSFLQAAFSDFDGDGDPDIVVTSQAVKDRLFLNNDGSFKEASIDGSGSNGRGVSFGDVNNDGWLDLAIGRPVFPSQAVGSELFINNQGKLTLSALETSGWTSGSQFVDLNGDGWLDLYEPAGFYTAPLEKPNARGPGKTRLAPQHNRSYLNLQGAGFVEATGLLGLDSELDGRGFAYLDFNRDGGTDIAVVNLNTPQIQLFQNLTPPKDSISLRLRGTVSNRDGIGAKVMVESGDLKQFRECHAGEGFGSQNSATLVLPISGETAEVTVKWPSGRTSQGRVRSGENVTFVERKANDIASFGGTP